MRKDRKNEISHSGKKRFVSFLPLIGAGLLAGGAIAGTVLSAVYAAKNYTESSEFAKNVSVKVKIDPMAFETDQSKLLDESLAESNTKFAAERLSSWLKENGQDSYDVQYELEAPTETVHQYYAYLTAKFKEVKVTSKLVSEQDEKVVNDPYLSVFETKGFNTNNKTFIYRWWNEGSKWGENQNHYSVFDFNDIFEIDEKVQKDATQSSASIYSDQSSLSNKAGIAWKVKNPDTSILKYIYYDMARCKVENDKQDPKSNKAIDGKLQPRIYVINNLAGMVNELNYHITNYVANQDTTKYKSIYKDTDYFKFAEKYYTPSLGGEPNYHLKTASVYTEGNPYLSDVAKVEQKANADVFNLIDSSTPGTIDSNVSSIISKYVEDVFTISNFQEHFPKKIRDNVTNDFKDVLAETELTSTKINYFWHSYGSKTISDNYMDNVINKSWRKAKILDIDFSKDVEQSREGYYNKFVKNYSTHEIDAKFTKNIFGSKLITVLAIGFLCFLIALGIILGALYRTTGVFSWICMMFMLSMTGLIAIKGVKLVISMSLLFGLFIISLVGFITALGICGRMRRRLNSNEDTQVIVKKTFLSSLWPSADISIVALIFGVCFTYIAPLGLNPLGLVLIIGGFANFLGTYLLNGGFHLLWFNNQVTINHYGWFGKPSNKAIEALSQGNNLVPPSLDGTKLTTPYYSSMSKKKFSVTNKAGMIGSIVLAALLVVCIVLFAVLGFTSSTMFHSSNCLAVTIKSTDVNIVNIVNNAGLTYTSFIKSSDGLIYYFYTNSISDSLISTLKSTEGVSTVIKQWVIGSTNRDILTSALISIIVGESVAFIYVGIRNNWTSLVPMLAGIMGLPLIMLGIASAAQIKFDEYVVLAFAFVNVVNAVVCTALASSINSAWSRKEGYNKEELKFIINTTLKNNALWLLLLICSYVLFIIVFTCTAPTGSTYAIALLLIGFIVTSFGAPFVVAYLLYLFLIVRNKALLRRAKKEENRKVVNYDEIDEQAIEGLNKFSKERPVPKADPIPQVKPEVKNEQNTTINN